MSYSSVGTYDDCPRKWLLRYCRGRSYRGSDLHLQRKLSTWAMFAGSVGDYVVTRVMLSRRHHGSWPAADRIAEYADNAVTEALDFSRGWRFAAENCSTRLHHRNGHQPLDRHYYSEPVEADEIKTAREDVARCVANFMDCGIREFIDSSPVSTWWDLKRPGKMPDSFMVAAVQVWAAPDFVFERDGFLYILDWKCGKSDASAFNRAMSQMHWYALLAAHIKGFTPERIRLKPVWLRDSDFSENFTVREPELRALSVSIQERHGKLVSLLDPATGDPLNVDDWPMRPEARRCAECSFRGRCPGAKVAQSQTAFAISA